MSQSVKLSARELFITRLFSSPLSLAEHHASWIARIDEVSAADPQGGGQRSVRHGWKKFL